MGWTDDGAGLFVSQRTATPTRRSLRYHELATRTVRDVLEIQAPVGEVRWAQMSGDGQVDVCRYVDRSSRLFLVDGLVDGLVGPSRP